MFFASEVFYYFTQERVKSLVAAMSKAFPNGRLVFDAAGKTAVKMISKTWIKNINGFGNASNGYYSARFQVYTLLLALSSVGIPNAIAKLISEKTAVFDYNRAKKLFKTALLIFSLIGIILSVGLFLLSEPIAKKLLNMKGAKYTLAALSPSIFFVCVSSVFRGYFSGINQMQVMSISQIIKQLFKSALTILFVIMSVKAGAEYVSAYANLATTAATVFGALFLLYSYKFKNSALPAKPLACCLIIHTFYPYVMRYAVLLKYV